MRHDQDQHFSAYWALLPGLASAPWACLQKFWCQLGSTVVPKQLKTMHLYCFPSCLLGYHRRGKIVKWSVRMCRHIVKGLHPAFLQVLANAVSWLTLPAGVTVSIGHHSNVLVQCSCKEIAICDMDAHRSVSVSWAFQ